VLADVNGLGADWLVARNRVLGLQPQGLARPRALLHGRRFHPSQVRLESALALHEVPLAAGRLIRGGR